MASKVYYARQSVWTHPSGDLNPGTGGTGGVLFGTSVKVPAPAAPAEVDDYKALSGRAAMLDYIQAEMSSLASIAYDANSPIIKAYHSYNSGMPTSFSGLGAEGPTMCTTRGMSSVQNVKASSTALANGSLNSQIASLVASYPSDLKSYLIINHEPENDSPAEDPTQWRAGVAKFCQQVIANKGSKDITPGVCLINWTLQNPNTSAASKALWNPAAEMTALGINIATDVVFTTDGYGKTPQSQTVASLFGPSQNVIRGWGFQRVGLSEVACHSYTSGDRAIAAAWVKSLASYVTTNNYEYCMWFLSDVGLEIAGVEGWYMYSDPQIVAWAQVCAGIYP